MPEENVIPSPVVPTPEPTEPPVVPPPTPEAPFPKKASHLLVWILVFVVLVILLGGLGYWFLAGQSTELPTNQTANTTPTLTKAPTNQKVLVPPADNRKPMVKIDTIAWSKPTLIASLKICNTEAGKEKVEDYPTACSATYYKVGAVQNGQYNGSDVILVKFKQQHPKGYYLKYFRFVKQDDELVLLGKYSENPKYYEFDTSRFTTDSTYTIPEMDLPDYLYGPGKNQVLVKVDNLGLSNFFDANLVKKAFTDKIVGDVYTTKDGVAISASEFDPEKSPEKLKVNGFYVPRPDGTFQSYNIFVNFLDKEVGSKNSESFEVAVFVPQITLSDRSKFGANHYHFYSGLKCQLSIDEYAEVEKTLTLTDLIEIGKTSGGDKVYTFRSDSQFQKEYDIAYGWFEGDLEEFKAEVPVFFWVDPFSRLIRFEREDFYPYPQCDAIVL